MKIYHSEFFCNVWKCINRNTMLCFCSYAPQVELVHVACHCQHTQCQYVVRCLILSYVKMWNPAASSFNSHVLLFGADQSFNISGGEKKSRATYQDLKWFKCNLRWTTTHGELHAIIYLIKPEPSCKKHFWLLAVCVETKRPHCFHGDYEGKRQPVADNQTNLIN